MPIVNVNLSSKNFTLYCNDGEEQLLLKLSQHVSSKITSLKEQNKSASFELLLVLAALSLQEEVFSLNEKIEKLSENNPVIEQEKYAETLNQIALYLEELAKKMSS